jgi:hypothetical protein
MQDFLEPVEAAKVETEAGVIYVQPSSGRSLTVNAPHLTINGVHLQASGILVSGDGRNWDFIRQYNSGTGQWSLPADALSARLVDGRPGDIVILGKVAEILLGAVHKLGQTNKALFLEAERRNLKNEILGLERHIADEREKLKKKEAELADIARQLPGRPS